MNNQSNSQNQNNNSSLGQVFNHSGKIAILLTIVAMLSMGIGAIALMEDASMEQKTIIKLSPNGFILENWIKKGEVERSLSKS